MRVVGWLWSGSLHLTGGKAAIKSLRHWAALCLAAVSAVRQDEFLSLTHADGVIAKIM